MNFPSKILLGIIIPFSLFYFNAFHHNPRAIFLHRLRNETFQIERLFLPDRRGMVPRLHTQLKQPDVSAASAPASRSMSINTAASSAASRKR
jgi:hypothetical protein